MAFSSRAIFFFFLSVLVVSSVQIHARESHFFSKFHRDSTPQDQHPNFVTVEANQKQQENQDPSFVPQSGNGYGLYGHETTYNNVQDFDDSTTTNNNNNEDDKKYEENATYEPYTTPSLSQTDREGSYKNSDNDRNYNYENNNNEKMNDDKYFNNNEYNYKANAYSEEKEPETFTGRGYNTYNNVNNNNYNNMGGQGMSDTRFMENGKYYFDVNDDKNHGRYYANRHFKHERYGQNNVNVNGEAGGRFYGTGTNNYNENSFRDPYDSRWEKNMMTMNNKEQQGQEFGEDQPEGRFNP